MKRLLLGLIAATFSASVAAEPGDSRVLPRDQFPCLQQQVITGIDLSLTKIEVGRHMPLGYHQGVQRCDREAIPDDVGKFILLNDPIMGHLAEQTAILTATIGLPDLPEVSIVTIPLHGIAGVAEGLEVAEVIGTTMIPGEDVVNFKSLHIGRYTAQRAVELGSLQDFVAKGSGDISC